MVVKEVRQQNTVRIQVEQANPHPLGKLQHIDAEQVYPPLLVAFHQGQLQSGTEFNPSPETGSRSPSVFYGVLYYIQLLSLGLKH